MFAFAGIFIMASTTTTTTAPATMQQPSVQALLQPQQPSPQKAGVVNDDPDKLLSEWLGELESLIGVSMSTEIS